MGPEYSRTLQKAIPAPVSPTIPIIVDGDKSSRSFRAAVTSSAMFLVGSRAPIKFGVERSRISVRTCIAVSTEAKMSFGVDSARIVQRSAAERFAFDGSDSVWEGSQNNTTVDVQAYLELFGRCLNWRGDLSLLKSRHGHMDVMWWVCLVGIVDVNCY